MEMGPIRSKSHSKKSRSSGPNLQALVSGLTTTPKGLLRKLLDDMSRDVRNRSSGFPTKSDTNRPVQSQKKFRIFKFWIEVEEEFYYPSSENKGADQLCSYCTADLRLCFRIGKNPFFS